MEHDCIGDLSWVVLDGVRHDGSGAGGCRGSGLKKKELFVSGKTKIHNVYGSTYIFYDFPVHDDINSGDPFGYFENDPPDASFSSATSGTGASSGVASGTNYSGEKILSDSDLQQIENNKKIYEEAGAEYGVPWQLLAALHYREHNLQVTNPSNGQGIYQLYSYTGGGTNSNRFAPGPVDDAGFLQQTKLAAEIIKNSVDGGDFSNSDNVKKAFFKYNGTAKYYKEKAIKMGFSQEQAENGEGSPYVMNKYDEQRDPDSANMSPFWPGRYVADGKVDTSSVEKRPGAFVVYEALGGNGQVSDACGSNPAGNGDIATVAMELSWEGRLTHPKNDPKPEYVQAMKEVGTYSSFGDAPPGASCAQFVVTVMRYSGADPNFNNGSFLANEAGTYMLEHPELYTEIAYDGSNPEILKSGDIFSTVGYGSGGHILIYAEVDGVRWRVDASHNHRTAEHTTFAKPWKVDDKGRTYRVFRRNQ